MLLLNWPYFMTNEINTKKLRQALGQCATGVTIVTTSGQDDEPAGITANSFSSVSLEPPMVLWSLAKSARSKNVFEAAEYFCVHVLGADQQELSERFACRGKDKFGDLEWTRGLGSVPLLSEYVARFQCRNASQYSVGDHIVFVGEILQYEEMDKRPLVVHGGRYALADRRMMAEVARSVGVRTPYPEDRRAPEAMRRDSEN